MSFVEQLREEGLTQEWVKFATQESGKQTAASFWFAKSGPNPELMDKLRSQNEALAKAHWAAFKAYLNDQFPSYGQEEVVSQVAVQQAPDITDLIKVEGKHRQAARIVRYFRRRKYPFCYGAPGSGKTHLFESFASEMGIEFLCLTLNPDSTKAEILGSKSPLTGEYFPAKFVRCWEFGGLVLGDEVALGPGGIANLLNGAMAQKSLELPDGRRVPMHENFFLAFADNSNLWGTDPLFAERQDLGSAFRDRLAFVKFHYDTDLELRILIDIIGRKQAAARFHGLVQNVREILKSEQLPLFASPRFSFAAATEFLDGGTAEEACEASLWQGLPEDTISGVKDKVVRLMTQAQNAIQGGR